MRANESFGEKARALGFSLGVHVLCVLLMFVGLAFTHQARPLSVQGPILEATIVTLSPPPKPAVSRPKPRPAKPPAPRPEPKPLEEIAPPVPPRADDTRDQERVDRMAVQPSEETQEQEERRKREQQLLEEEERLAQLERERQQQMEDLRRLREEATERRKREEQLLAKLEEQAPREVPKPAVETPQPAEGQLAGNEGVNDDLLSRYRLAMQRTIQDAWRRPDNLPERVTCWASVTQIPGGEVISVELTRCPFDDAGRRSVEAALMRQPLPYTGYESVFQRRIDVPFCYPTEACAQ